MTKDLGRLLKLRLMGLFKINEITHEKNKMRKGRNLVLMVLLVPVLLVIIGYITGYAYFLTTLDCGPYIPALTMVEASLISLVFTLFRANDELFHFKDYDMLMSLPIKTSLIVISRISYLYFFNLLLTLLVMVPSGIIYFIFESFSVLGFLFWFFGLFLIPLLPMMAAVVWTYAIAFLASKSRNSKRSTFWLYVISIGLLILPNVPNFFHFETTLDLSKPENLTLICSQAMESLQNRYFISKLYRQAVVQQSAFSFGLLALLALLVVGLFVLLVTPKYQKIVADLKAQPAKNAAYSRNALEPASQLLALYKIELKRYFTTGIYFFNTVIGVIFAWFISVAVLFVDVDSLLKNALPLETFKFAEDLPQMLPFLIAACLSMSCTSCVSISLEGKTVWLKKSLPLSIEKIIQGKILVNLTLTLPAAIAASFLLSFGLGYTFFQWLTVLLFLVSFAFLSAVFGLFINFQFVNYDWETETQVVKQSLASMLGILSGLVFALLCAVASYFLRLNLALVFLLLTCVIVLLTLVFYHSVKQQSL